MSFPSDSSQADAFDRNSREVAALAGRDGGAVFARRQTLGTVGDEQIPTPTELEARKSALAGLKVDEQIRAIVAAMNRGEGACPRLPDLTDEAARQVRERMRKQGWDCNLDATRVWWRPA